MSNKVGTDWRGRAFNITQRDNQRWYDVDDRALPSATTVIGAVWPFTVPPSVEATAEHARDRGQEVHRAIQYSTEGRLDRSSLDPEVKPRVEAFEDWQERTGWIANYVEASFWHLDHGYGCTPDQVGWFPDEAEQRVRILEIKPATAATVGLQTIAAAMAVRKCLGLKYTPERHVLFISEHGAREEILTKRGQDRAGFLAALTCFNYGIERKLWKSKTTQ